MLHEPPESRFGRLFSDRLWFVGFVKGTILFQLSS
jgi:hypothetical protein